MQRVSVFVNVILHLSLRDVVIRIILFSQVFFWGIIKWSFRDFFLLEQILQLKSTIKTDDTCVIVAATI